ncbi:hypothetical protein CN391_25965 [Bacillus anthracis]|nr:hypothetical protein CN391_25965 [Bacillus anthracis]PFB06890.1 hypothetical protein CN385_02570 [Bacillus anthracis]PFU22973.1 hypothetical protein COK80_25830 [Bacillus anthracis]PFU90818.1 hypothetical protein COK92_20755 [Bacillus anthracis]
MKLYRKNLHFSALEQPLFLLALQLIAFVLIICIIYGILYNTIVNYPPLNVLTDCLKWGLLG